MHFSGAQLTHAHQHLDTHTFPIANSLGGHAALQDSMEVQLTNTIIYFQYLRHFIA